MKKVNPYSLAAFYLVAFAVVFMYVGGLVYLVREIIRGLS